MTTDAQTPEIDFMTKEFVQNALVLLQNATGLNTSVYAQPQKKKYGWESWWAERKNTPEALYTIQVMMTKSGFINGWWLPGPRVIDGMSARANTVKLRGAEDPAGSGSLADKKAVLLSNQDTMVSVEETYNDLVRVTIYSRCPYTSANRG